MNRFKEILETNNLSEIINICIIICNKMTNTHKCFVNNKSWSKKDLIYFIYNIDKENWGNVNDEEMKIIEEIYSLYLADARLDHTSSYKKYSVIDYLTNTIEMYLKEIESYIDISNKNSIEKAHLLKQLRIQVAKNNIIYSNYDGESQLRTERYLSKKKISIDNIPKSLTEILKKTLKFNLPTTEKGYKYFFSKLIIKSVENDVEPEKVVTGIVDWLNNIAIEGQAYSLIVAPRNTKFIRPWKLNFNDMFCYINFSEEYNPEFKKYGERKVLSAQNIQKAVYARMIKNKVVLANSYEPSTITYRYRLVPGDIANFENLHSIPNHAMTDISKSLKIKLGLRIFIHNQLRIYREFADLRLIRSSGFYSEDDIAVAICCKEWIEVCLATIYAYNIEVKNY